MPTEDATTSAVVETTETVQPGEQQQLVIAGEETLEPETPPEIQIPKSRYDSVAGEKRQLEGEVERLKGKLEALESHAPTAPEPTPTPSGSIDFNASPDGLSQDDQVEWRVINAFKKHRAEALGFDPAQLQESVGNATQTAAYAAEMKARALMTEAGLDMNDPHQQQALGHILRGGAGLPEAVTMLKNIRGESTAPAAPPPARPNVLTDGASAALTSSNSIPFDAEAATKMAAKGVTVPHLSIEQIDKLKKRGRFAQRE